MIARTNACVFVRTFDPDAYSLAFRLDSYTDTPGSVPEPGAWVLLVGGLVAMLFWRRSKRGRR